MALTAYPQASTKFKERIELYLYLPFLCPRAFMAGYRVNLIFTIALPLCV
jgi:hypothetical protein